MVYATVTEDAEEKDEPAKGVPDDSFTVPSNITGLYQIILKPRSHRTDLHHWSVSDHSQASFTLTLH